jgi:hypothetical protein
MSTQGLLFQSNSTIQNLFMHVNLEQIILLSLNIACSRYDTAEYSTQLNSTQLNLIWWNLKYKSKRNELVLCSDFLLIKASVDMYVSVVLWFVDACSGGTVVCSTEGKAFTLLPSLETLPLYMRTWTIASSFLVMYMTSLLWYHVVFWVEANLTKIVVIVC